VREFSCYGIINCTATFQSIKHENLYNLVMNSVAEPRYFDAAPDPAPAPERQNDAAPAPTLPWAYIVQSQKFIHFDAAPV
jgi:hypothetical protein